MRRLLTWLLVSLGIAALVRRLRRRGKETELAPPPPEQDPADELRRKLAETRSEDDAAPSAEPPAQETPAEKPAAEERDVEERRSDVHGQGRATLDEMRAPDDA